MLIFRTFRLYRALFRIDYYQFWTINHDHSHARQRYIIQLLSLLVSFCSLFFMYFVYLLGNCGYYLALLLTIFRYFVIHILETLVQHFPILYNFSTSFFLQNSENFQLKNALQSSFYAQRGAH